MTHAKPYTPNYDTVVRRTVSAMHSLSRKVVFDHTWSKESLQVMLDQTVADLQDELEQELYVQGLQRKGDMEHLTVAVPSSNLLQMDYWVAVRCDVEPRE